MSKPLHILILEDSPVDYQAALLGLSETGLKFEARQAVSEAEFRRELQACEPDLVLADYRLPDYDGLSALALVQQLCPHIPYIMLAAEVPAALASAIFAQGAKDYVLKDRMERLGPSAVRAIREAQEARQREAAEAARVQAEAAYKSLFDNAVQGLFRTSPEGRLLTANAALARMLGFATPEELITARADIKQQGYADPEDRERFQQEIQRQGAVRGREVRVLDRKGRELWVSEDAWAVRDAQGQVLYYEGSMEDITARREAEAARQKTESYHRLRETALQAAANVIVMLMREQDGIQSINLFAQHLLPEIRTCIDHDDLCPVFDQDG